MTDQLAVAYEGTEPFPDGSPTRTFEGAVRAAVTTAIVVVPFGGLAVAAWLAWGHGLRPADILLAAAFYLVTGLGVTVGFHRLLTHRSFTAAPALRVVLAIAGSMSFEGEVIGWATSAHWPVPARLDSRRRGRGKPEPALQPGGRRTERAAASRRSPLPASGDRIR